MLFDVVARRVNSGVGLPIMVRMNFLRKPGCLGLLIGVILLLLAGWLFFMVAMNASLDCVRCDCRYYLSSPDSVCRFTAILAYLFDAALIGAIVSFIVAWYRHWRAKRTAAQQLIQPERE